MNIWVGLSILKNGKHMLTPGRCSEVHGTFLGSLKLFWPEEGLL